MKKILDHSINTKRALSGYEIMESNNTIRSTMHHISGDKDTYHLAIFSLSEKLALSQSFRYYRTEFETSIANLTGQ